LLVGAHAGDSLDANIEAGRIVLTPRRRRARHVRIISDPLTGLPVSGAGTGVPPLSSKEVDEILAIFP